MLQTVSPTEAYALLQQGEAILIDIRDTDEYATCSIPDSRLIPLAIVEKHPLFQGEGDAAKRIIFTCNSGRRTRQAAERLERIAPESVLLDGGVRKWKKAGLPVMETPQRVLPMFRQIQIGAGMLVLLGLAGSAVWHPFYWLSAFVGAGLIFAGLTGFCGLGLLLARMPWNRKA